MTCAHLLSPARAPPHPLTPASLTSQFRLEQRGEPGSAGRPAWRTTPGEASCDETKPESICGGSASRRAACVPGRRCCCGQQTVVAPDPRRFVTLAGHGGDLRPCARQTVRGQTLVQQEHRLLVDYRSLPVSRDVLRPCGPRIGGALRCPEGGKQ